MALSKKQKENTKRKYKFPFILNWWKSLDRRVKLMTRRVIGGMLLIVSLYVLICCLSYLFTWKSDYSILDWSDVQALPANLGSRLGLKISWFLVGGCFGLSAFFLPVLTGLIGLHLCDTGKYRLSLKTAMKLLIAAPLFSFILAYVSGLVSSDHFFGGGLGGFAGAEFSKLCEAAMGSTGTGLLLLVLLVFWLLLASRRFALWFVREAPAKVSAEETSTDATVTEGESSGMTAKDGGETGQEAAFGEGIPEANPDDSPEELPEETLEPSPEVTAVVVEQQPSVTGSQPSVDGKQPVSLESSGEGETGRDVIVATKDLDLEVKEELPRIDNREELERYQFPSLDLLQDYASSQFIVPQSEQSDYIFRIRTTLQNFKIKVQDITAIAGPTVTLYKVIPAPGVKMASIKNIQSDIGISLGAKGVRVVKLDDAVGIEVANSKSSIVPLKGVLNNEAFRETKAELPIAIGCTITKKVKVFDLCQAPHLLVAGATQQGKSVGLNVIVASLLYAKHPSELKFVFVDPKMVEFSSYGRLLKHYLAVLPTAASEEDEKSNAIIKKAKDAFDVLNSLCVEMDDRYKLLADAGVNKLKDYNEKYKDRKLLPTAGHKYLPYIVVVIDEFADLTMSSGFGQEGKALSRGISSAIIRLAQKGRAAGIHLIIATQRPSVSVITGDIKTNFPMRIAFRTVSRIDSQTILDSPGAENLIGKGDMLFYAGVETERIQCAYVSTDEIDKITKFIESQNGYKACYTTPYYLPEPPSTDGESGGAGGPIDISKIDDMFADAARLVVSSQRGSTSDLQRKLGLGYARAGRIMDQLEAAGVVGPQDGSKPRQVLVSDYAELESIITSFTTRNE